MSHLGCQTFTWEMLGARWIGTVDEILDVVAGAGYEGIEITNTMIHEYEGKPAEFATALKARRLTMPAFGYGAPTGFTDPRDRAAELAGAEQAMRFAGAFPGCLLIVGGASAHHDGDIDAQIAAAAEFYNEVGRRGRAVGVEVAFHPSTHHGSILVSRAQYDRVLALTDPSLVGWNPDSGHIVRGKQNLLATLGDYRDRIVHVHLKDVDAQGVWQPMGEGICDIPAVLAFLYGTLHFQRWVVLEEESRQAEADPIAAVHRNKRYIKSITG